MDDVDVFVAEELMATEEVMVGDELLTADAPTHSIADNSAK